eukprot:Filipodium_phascolosomae@DN3754_c0_g1_i1.p1
MFSAFLKYMCATTAAFFFLLFPQYGAARSSTPVAVDSNYESEAINSTAAPVIVLYYETLCPFCRRYILDQMIPLAKDQRYKYGLSKTTLVPYGNAHLVSTGEVECQHGEAECRLNKLSACGLRYYNDDFVQARHFLQCVESHSDSWRLFPCAGGSGTSLVYLFWCYYGGLGEGLMKNNRERTERLHGRNYVPWVTVNDQHRVDFETNLTVALDSYHRNSTAPTVTTAQLIY